MDTETGAFKAKRSMVAMRKSIFGHCAGRVNILEVSNLETELNHQLKYFFSSEQGREEDRGDWRIPGREVLGQSGELQRGRRILVLFYFVHVDNR